MIPLIQTKEAMSRVAQMMITLVCIRFRSIPRVFASSALKERRLILHRISMAGSIAIRSLYHTEERLHIS